MTDRTLLVGDAGGTNVRFALAHIAGGRVTLSEIWKRPGEQYPTFEAALDAYLTETRADYAGASFGFAGVTGGSTVELLNRGWVVDLAAVEMRLGGCPLTVVNDFIAMARSAPELSGDQLKVIKANEAVAGGSIAVGGPGTGFGVGILRKTGGGWVVVGGEGGHQAFTPETEIEWKLAERLRESLGYVSNEIVTAGMGFDDTRDALFEVMGLKPKPLTQAEVIDAAHAGDALALEFCRIRARATLTCMGNMALMSNATGGVFVAGGVSQRLEPWLKEPATLDRFYKRGVRTGLVKPIPINLIASEAAPLIGSAYLWLDEQARGWL
ncbi:MAG TPA: glucokinase [Hyphomonadaceae bacterium]|nr:glucokinase [Hyphomonadaceae bacterium]HPN04917.1 glucokinase [Hyphomonadaceae bacterium]